MALLRSVATVGGYTMLSRVTGFARDMLIAALVGAGPVADAFFVAFKLPNFFRRLFAEGAFNAAFVPLFAGRLAAEGEAGARDFAEDVLAVMVVALLGFVTAPADRHAVADVRIRARLLGRSGEVRPRRHADAPRLPLSAVHLAGVAARRHAELARQFAAAAATPILLNIVLIGALLGLAPYRADAGPRAGLGRGGGGRGPVRLAAVALRARRLPAAAAAAAPDARREAPVRLIVPGALGAGVVQINLMIDVVIASLLPTGVDLVPLLRRPCEPASARRGRRGGRHRAAAHAVAPDPARRDARGGPPAEPRARVALLLTLPAAAALIALATPIVTVLFERGAFDPGEAQATAEALVAFAAGLPAYVLVKVLAPGFFAREDTRTPVRIAIVCVGVNVALNVTSACSARSPMSASRPRPRWPPGSIRRCLRRRSIGAASSCRTRDSNRKLPRILAAAVAMAVLAALAARWAAVPLAAGEAVRASALAAIVAGGIALFAIFAFATGAADLAELRQALGRGFARRAARGGP